MSNIYGLEENKGCAEKKLWRLFLYKYFSSCSEINTNFIYLFIYLDATAYDCMTNG
jgi:hypothetical protein